MPEKVTFVGIFGVYIQDDTYILRIHCHDKTLEYVLSQLQVRALATDAIEVLDRRLHILEAVLSSNTAASIGDDDGRQAPPTNCPRPTASESGH